MRMKTTILMLALTGAWATVEAEQEATTPGAEQPSLELYISADMEGGVGVVSGGLLPLTTSYVQVPVQRLNASTNSSRMCLRRRSNSN